MTSIVLRPYQTDTIEVARAKFREGQRRVILQAPTGAGKTEMAMDIVRSAVLRGRVAFVANRIELINQTSRRFTVAGIEHGVVQAQNTRDIHRRVLVGSIQSMARRGCPDGLGLLVVDEAHAAAGTKAYRELFQTANCPVLGLSATPWSRGLGKHYDELGGPLFESIASSVTVQDLVDLGFLTDVDIYSPSEPDLEGIRIVAGDYEQEALGKAVNRPTLIGDIVQHWKQLARGKRTICFATNITHSKAIVQEFIDNGITAEHIDCYTPEEERKAIIARTLSGETTILSNVAILAEGFDCPALECMILARPTRSLIRYFQMIGRVMRIADGKERALVLDHSGSCRRLGFPTDPQPMELHDGKAKESSDSVSKKPEELPSKCPKCHYMRPPKSKHCPACGFVPVPMNDVEAAEGKLHKMEKGKKDKSQLTPDQKERFYAELLGYASKKGYSEGWAYHKCKEHHGTYPPRKVPPRDPSQETLGWIKHTNIKHAKQREAAAKMEASRAAL